MLYLIYTSDTKNQIGTECLFEKTCKEDKDYFKTLTLKYHNVIMGRKTFQSIKKPLKNRQNIVLSRSSLKSSINNVYITDKVELDSKQDYIIAGGKEIYEMFWDKVDVVYHTIHKLPDFGGVKLEPDYSKFALFERTENDELIKETWIRQPYKDLPISFDNNIRFSKLYELTKAYPDFNQQITASNLVKNDNYGIFISQKPSKHNIPKGINICVREVYKKLGQVKSGEYWDKDGNIICEGCMNTNHSEYLAVNKAKERGLDFNGGTCYLYGHYWSCQSCQEALKSIGIKKIVMSRDFVKAFLNIE